MGRPVSSRPGAHNCNASTLQRVESEQSFQDKLDLDHDIDEGIFNVW